MFELFNVRMECLLVLPHYRMELTLFKAADNLQVDLNILHNNLELMLCNLQLLQLLIKPAIGFRRHLENFLTLLPHHNTDARLQLLLVFIYLFEQGTIVVLHPVAFLFVGHSC